MGFEFATAGRILFGAGTVQKVGPLAASMGSRALLVVRDTDDSAVALSAALDASGVAATFYCVAHEPTTEMVKLGTQLARDIRASVVIGMGGGSVIDTAKAIAALLTNGGEPLDYLEIIGRGQAITAPSAPWIAVPTTAGTGAEVTYNAVLASPVHHVKVSLRSPWMLPQVAIVDPELTLSLPPAITASTGLDAFTQVIEPFVSHLSNPMTDGVCREAIPRAAGALLQAFRRGDDLVARESMALVSLFGGIALANAKLGAVHGIAGPLGGMFDAPHGAVCGRLLPFVMETNVAALQARAPESPSLQRYREVAVLVTGDPAARAEDGVAWMAALCAELGVPGLRTYGIMPSDLPEIAEKAARSSSMKGNPVRLSDDELISLLERAL